ncbi:hypothetical protein SB748_31790, partial [Rhizobium sp. SIMBA_035]
TISRASTVGFWRIAGSLAIAGYYTACFKVTGLQIAGARHHGGTYCLLRVTVLFEAAPFYPF